MAIAKMHELRSLQLICNDLTNQGLEAILDKCRRLESLCICNCCNISMTGKMRARIKTKRLLVIYVDDGESREDFEPSSPDTECSTCHNYFGRHKEGYQKPYVNDMEAMVISTVCKLRSVQLYRNDLTSGGLAAILEQCPRLEFLDVCNCLNIVRDSSLQPKYGWIKTKKLTTRLLTDDYNHRFFNPKALDIQNCRNIILNNCRNIFIYNAWKGAKYNRILLRKMTRNYHRRTKIMMASIENYMADLNIGNFDYRVFDGAEFDSYRYFKPKEYNHGSPIRECSTCLMFEYFAEHWGVLDLDDYADYYDPSYGLDGHDEIDFGVHDRMINKKVYRYLNMERK